MSDPAMVAAMRAMKQRADNHIARGAIAAREALAPIRELHKPGTTAGDEDEPYCETCGHYDGLSADFLHQTWPCDTARLIYSEKELTND